MDDPQRPAIFLEHADAKQRLNALLREAHDLGEHLGRVSHGLSAHPERVIIGTAPFGESRSEWDIIPAHPLPSIERLIALTNEIREVTQKVEELRERLILMGRADLVEEPDGFFQ